VIARDRYDMHPVSVCERHRDSDSNVDCKMRAMVTVMYTLMCKLDFDRRRD